MDRYSIFIQWCDEDKAYLVTIPEFAKLVVMPCTHGDSRQEAISNAEEVIQMYLKEFQKDNDKIPEPDYFEFL